MQNSDPELCTDYSELNYYRYLVLFLDSRRKWLLRKSHGSLCDVPEQVLTKVCVCSLGLCMRKIQDKGLTYELSETVQDITILFVRSLTMCGSI